MDDSLSRVASLIDDDGTTHLVDYSCLGRNTFVKTDYPEPDLRYDLAMGAGDDPYDGFDRFGRIVDSRWYDYGSSADVDRILYGCVPVERSDVRGRIRGFVTTLGASGERGQSDAVAAIGVPGVGSTDFRNTSPCLTRNPSIQRAG